jgi:hypothetical protein
MALPAGNWSTPSCWKALHQSLYPCQRDWIHRHSISTSDLDLIWQTWVPANSKKLWELHCSILKATELSVKNYVERNSNLQESFTFLANLTVSKAPISILGTDIFILGAPLFFPHSSLQAAVPLLRSHLTYARVQLPG